MILGIEKDELRSSFFLWFGVMLIFLPLLASYTSIVSWINFHDHQRILTLVSALFFFIAFSVKSIRALWFDVFYLKVVVGIIIWLVVVSVFSELPFWSFVEVSYLLNILLFSFAIAGFFEGRALFLAKSALMVLVSFFVIYYLMILTGVVYLAISEGKVDAATLVSGYANFRFLNQVQVFLFLFIAFGICFLRNKLRLTAFLILSFTVFILLLTTARGAILSILIVSSAVFVFDRKSRNFLLVVLGSMLLGLALYLLLIFSIEVINPVLEGNRVRGLNLDSTSGRLEMWLEVLYLAPTYLIIGSGGLHYPLVSDVQIGAHPHNIILQFAIEWGYGITLTVLLITFSSLKLNSAAIFQFWATGNDRIYRPFIASFSGLLLYSMFSGVLAMPLSSQCFIFALSGVIHFFRKLSIQTHGEVLHFSAFRFRVLLIGAALLVYWALMFPQAYSVFEGESLYGKPLPSLYAPRLWLDGVIR